MSMYSKNELEERSIKKKGERQAKFLDGLMEKVFAEVTQTFEISNISKGRKHALKSYYVRTIGEIFKLHPKFNTLSEAEFTAICRLYFIGAIAGYELGAMKEDKNNGGKNR